MSEPDAFDGMSDAEIADLRAAARRWADSQPLYKRAWWAILERMHR